MRRDVCPHCDAHSAAKTASGVYRCERCGREMPFREVNFRTVAEIEEAKERVRQRASEFNRTHSQKYLREHRNVHIGGISRNTQGSKATPRHTKSI